MNDAQRPPFISFDDWFRACQDAAERHGLNLCHAPPERWNELRQTDQNLTEPRLIAEDAEILA